MSRGGISGGQTSDKICKFVVFFFRFFFYSLKIKRDDDLIVMQNEQFVFRQFLRHYCLQWGHLRLLLHTEKVAMITFTHNLPLSSLRYKVLHFLLSRINQLDPNIFELESHVTCLPRYESMHVTLGPFIRGKMRRVLHKTRTFRINGTFRLK